MTIIIPVTGVFEKNGSRPIQTINSLLRVMTAPDPPVTGPCVTTHFIYASQTVLFPSR